MADNDTSKSKPNQFRINGSLPDSKEEKNLSGHVRPRELPHKYELIDNDPHFRRVMRYYRPSDYLTWAGFTIGVPLVFSGMMLIWKTPRMFGTPLIGGKYWRVTTGLGFTSGFLVSYQDSCKNAREVKMDMEEMVAKLRAGEPLYGRSQMDPYHQEVSASQSRYAQLKFHIFPFLNFSNHGEHGVDIGKYIKALPEEEQQPYLLQEKEKLLRNAYLELSAEINRREGLPKPKGKRAETQDEKPDEEKDEE